MLFFFFIFFWITEKKMFMTSWKIQEIETRPFLGSLTAKTLQKVKQNKNAPSQKNWRLRLTKEHICLFVSERSTCTLESLQNIYIDLSIYSLGTREIKKLKWRNKESAWDNLSFSKITTYTAVKTAAEFEHVWNIIPVWYQMLTRGMRFLHKSSASWHYTLSIDIYITAFDRLLSQYCM